MTESPEQLPTIDKHPKLMYIDCLRGYAILMVIICHVVRQYPELPYRAMQLAQTGWHGVQFFFLVSCVTLMVSVHGVTGRSEGRAEPCRSARTQSVRNANTPRSCCRQLPTTVSIRSTYRLPLALFVP